MKNCSCAWVVIEFLCHRPKYGATTLRIKLAYAQMLQHRNIYFNAVSLWLEESYSAAVIVSTRDVKGIPKIWNLE